MAYLTINKDGTECISEEKLIRWPPTSPRLEPINLRSATFGRGDHQFILFKIFDIGLKKKDLQFKNIFVIATSIVRDAFKKVSM